ncbi:MAG: hypothetical protein LC789_00225 [Actinobacteria bacterium]|nr:hypothetical protein [Actinomycetota bacterium]MCA1720218.1 hypothetical protein [Actinomycetota bacterium]
MSVRRRKVTYFSIRAVAVVAFLTSAFVMPPGAAAGIVCLGAGAVAVLAGIGVNAGGPGEQAGARRQMDHYNAIRPPQGDWPPFDPGRVVDGEVVRPDVTPP